MFYRNAADLFGIEKRVPSLTQGLYTHAKTRIPGGTQLLSKRPENMCPNQWPPYYREARGCEIWDLDGRHYYDMSTNGIGACLLGFSDPDVNAAVIRRVNLGSASTLNPAEEVELADLLCSIHPWATQARFTRAGGETGSVAVRIARATTDRSVVAFCGYHGWHDWYLSANLGESDALRGHLLPGLNPLGVPRELRGTSVPFTYNNREEFRRIIETHGKNLACVVMEPCRGKDPEPGFLEFVRDEAHRAGALLIFDEVTIGFRRNFGGAHLALGVNPDMAFFAKAIGNGFPIGAVIGTREAMEGAHVSFISSTSWTEGVGPAASVASIKKLKERDVSTHVARIGGLVLSAWKSSAEKHGLPVEFDGGYPCLAHFKFNHPESEALRTLYTQLMLDRGFLAGVSIYPTLAHTDEIIGLYASAVDEVFGEIAGIIGRGDIRAALKGPVALSGFKRLLS
jgi:glutamate-1-semialdehyde 2,1-aminomutase